MLPLRPAQRRRFFRTLLIIGIFWILVAFLQHPGARSNNNNKNTKYPTTGLKHHHPTAEPPLAQDTTQSVVAIVDDDGSASNSGGNGIDKGDEVDAAAAGRGDSSSQRGIAAQSDDNDVILPAVAADTSRFISVLPKGSGDGKGGGEDTDRLRVVVEAIRHSWKGYRAHAWGKDEYLPISKQTRNWGGGHGIGATIIDALDTLLIAGLHDEALEAVLWVETNLTFSQSIKLSLFETTIRVLGGLLSAYQITGREKILQQAKDLGDRLMPAFETDSGLPDNYVNLLTRAHEGAQWNAFGHILSEFGSLQLEFRTLSHLTGDDKYDRVARRCLEVIRPKCHPMCPGVFHGRGVAGGNDAGLGSFGDSFYEYMLKQWILTGKVEPFFEQWWNETAHHIIKNSIDVKGIVIPNGASHGNTMEHLACFSGGLFALSYYHSLKTSELELAEAIAHTCHEMYQATPSKLSPDVVTVRGFGNAEHTFAIQDPKYILRPETVESYFYLWRVTGKEKYREWGYEVLRACNEHLRVPDGYVGTSNVMAAVPPHHDMMETFWLGETLKYLYLLFADDSVLSLDDVVFNTEAHPFRVWRETAPPPTTTASSSSSSADKSNNNEIGDNNEGRHHMHSRHRMEMRRRNGD